MMSMARATIPVLLLASCQAAPGSGREDGAVHTHDGALRIELEPSPVRRAVEGELALVRVRLRNVSDNYFIFLQSITDAETGSGLRWFRSRPGRLKYDKANDLYLYERWVEAERFAPPPRTLPVFNDGLIIPRWTSVNQRGETETFEEERTFKVFVRLFRLPRTLRVDYVILSFEEMEQLVYVFQAKPSEAQSGSELRDRFLRQGKNWLERYVARRHYEDPESPIRRDVFLLPPAGPGFTLPVRSSTVTVNMAVAPREFSAEAAAAKAGLSVSCVIDYSIRLDSWVVADPLGQVSLVNERETIPVGRTDPRLFLSLDLSREEAGRDPSPIEVQFLNRTEVFYSDFFEYLEQLPPRGAEIPAGKIYFARSGEQQSAFLLLRPEDLRGFLSVAGRETEVEDVGPRGRVRKKVSLADLLKISVEPDGRVVVSQKGKSR